ncbi:PEP-dependent dihydroxyacetone kinase, phosphoryl donor subunit DhaM [subsurface metagenome]
MVGIVIVAHSRKLAEGLKELADQMSQGRVSIVAAGGLDNNNTIGTSVDRILKAINDAYQDEGVLVLMDLGSAVLSTKMAIQMLPPEKQAKVVMSEAPIVEGSIAAVVEASIGSTLEKVDSTARNVVTKAKVTGQIPLVYIKSPEVSVKEGPLADKIVLTLTNKMGLHARPAAVFVQSASKFKSNILVT